MIPDHSALSPQQLVQGLNWRYAVKKFDPTQKISPEVWKSLEAALVLTPSSFGLQPWRFYVITNPDIKNKLVPVSWNQKQVAEGSHVVVFAIRKNLAEVDVDRFLGRTAEVQKVPLESLGKYKKVLLRFLAQPSDKFNVNEWAARQVYIALGNFMTAAALLGVDTCPMEGLEPSKYDEILGLEKEGYATSVVCVAGFRASEDKYATLPKVRYATEDVIKNI
ncbi:MAG: putative NAD(P)H nitroreductase YfkO [Elusimicrobia bacterium]|nr:putative NAD(P)H nitroreductase YfkO [Elusimicrobiota bacterium]